MLYREIIAVCSHIHAEHTNKLCGQKVEFFNLKAGGSNSNHRALKVTVQHSVSVTAINKKKNV